jgi:pimeloyl-ACP methyl ester carboxylesterase/1-acyl-sn-glycerol-3-phosphate acyltransferase
LPPPPLKTIPTPTAWPPKTPLEMSEALRKVYTDLEQPGMRHKQATPTLRFSHVPSPRAAAAAEKAKPLALYLPGLDGYGISASTHQFPDLAKTFDLWRLTILPQDKSSFTSVVNAIVDFVDELVAMDNKDDESDRKKAKKVVLIGESCGGLMAAAVAIKLQKRSSNNNNNRIHGKDKNDNPLQGLVLVNPATSFGETQWATLAPILASLQHDVLLEDKDNGNNVSLDPLSVYSVVGSLTLSTLIPDNGQLGKIVNVISQTVNVPPRSRQELQNLVDASIQAFREMGTRLPPDLLTHRVLQWLQVGHDVVDARLSDIQVPTLVVAGRQDKLMPSATEADRLVQKLHPWAEKLDVRDRGHFVLDDAVNLTEAILYSKIDPLGWKHNKRAYDAVTDWKLPPAHEVEAVIEKQVTPLRTLHSPVFFSTDENGKRWKGLSKFPATNRENPILIVANHQFLAIDMALIYAELFEQKGITLRGLAHPVGFASAALPELRGRVPGLISPTSGAGQNPFMNFQLFGAVEVSPRNYYRLLKNKETVLLFPGGASEAMTGRKDYPLFWPEDMDFVRTAAKFNATIVPLAAVGMVDGFNVVLEREELLNLPVLGELVRNATTTPTNARYGKRQTGELQTPPAILPGVPARNYFVFGKPFDTASVDPKDLQACEKLYRATRDEVRSGLDDILRSRVHDPFLNTPKRMAYERVFNKQAPTFSIDELR